MSNLQRYAKATVLLNGSLLSEESQVTIKRMSGAQRVKTVAKGFAGLSPGAPMMEISVENAVPSADFEVNPGAFILGNEVVEITVFAAGRTLTSKGFIENDNFSHGAESPSKLSFDGPFQWADWE